MERGATQPNGPESLNSGVHGAHELYERTAVEAEAHRLLAEADLPSVEVGEQERHDNARTAIWEALTASGHLSRIEMKGASVEEINAQVRTRLINGVRAASNEHERKRRFAELCNELIIEDIHERIVQGELPPNLVFHELSDYPTALRDSIADKLGYRSSNHKGFNRATWLVTNADGSYTRVSESISRSNSDDKSALNFFAEHNIALQQRETHDLTTLSTPFISQHPAGPVTVQKKLDAYRGPNVRYGDSYATRRDHIEYHSLRRESKEKEDQMKFYADELSNYRAFLDTKIATGVITAERGVELEKRQLLEILRSICLRLPEYTVDTFGAEAAHHYNEYALFMARGDAQRAYEAYEAAKRAEKPVVICGSALTDREIEDNLMPKDAQQLSQEFPDKWTMGVCRIDECPTRPNKTWVGPCSICKHCQDIFDHKKEPSKIYQQRRIIGAHVGSAVGGGGRGRGGVYQAKGSPKLRRAGGSADGSKETKGKANAKRSRVTLTV